MQDQITPEELIAAAMDAVNYEYSMLYKKVTVARKSYKFAWPREAVPFRVVCGKVGNLYLNANLYNGNLVFTGMNDLGDDGYIGTNIAEYALPTALHDTEAFMKLSDFCSSPKRVLRVVKSLRSLQVDVEEAAAELSQDWAEYLKENDDDVAYLMGIVMAQNMQIDNTALSDRASLQTTAYETKCCRDSTRRDRYIGVGSTNAMSELLSEYLL